MRRVCKQLVALAAGAAFCIGAAFPAGAAWRQDDIGRWSYYRGEKAVSGWHWIDGAWYHFDRYGIMQTGWVWDDAEKAWYYCCRDGRMTYGWQKVDGQWYFLGAGGAMRTGWLWDQGSWYYLKPDGAMATGWIEDAGRRYYLLEDGRMAVGQVQIDGVSCSFGSDGALEEGLTSAVSSWEERMLELVNQARAEAGVPAVAHSDTLSRLAAVRAEECTESFGHTRPDGSEWSTIFDGTAGVSGKRGENLARNYDSPEAVISAWLASSGHRQNLLSEEFNYMGTAFCWDETGACYWVQLFAERMN